MKNMNRYTFYPSNRLSIADARARLQQDDTLPADERAALLSNIDWLLFEAAGCERFKGVKPEDWPCARLVFDGVIREIESGLKRVEVRNNRAGLYAILDLYGLTKRLELAPISPSWQPLFQLTDGYYERDVKRLIVLLRDRAPNSVSDVVKDELFTAMMQDPTLQNWEEAWVMALRAWNWARSNIAGWPDVEFELPNTRAEPMGLPWTAFPEGLRDEVLAGLQRKPAVVTWIPEVTAAFEIDLDNLAKSADRIRICMGALVRSGRPPAEIRVVRDITNPESFDWIHRQLIVEAKGQTTRLVRTKLATLATLAKREGSLSEDELAQIADTMKFVDNDLEAYVTENPSHADVASEKLGRDATIRKLRRLPLDVFAEAAMQPITRSLSCELKQAVILTLRLCTRASDSVLKKVVFEKHLYEMTGKYAGWLGFYVPAAETANGKERVGVLRKPYADVIRVFSRCYRASLDTSGMSPYLLPSTDEKPLTASTISTQQTEFLTRRLGEECKSSHVNALLKKAALENDPEAIELVRRAFGHSDFAHIEKAAEPFKNDRDRQEHSRMVVGGHLKARVSKRSGEGV